ncbi:MAG: ISL3 family transposase [Saprospiraceae bacterium]|nr:ISL3 family transposase [Saprospiraceae bacterium]
MDTTVYELLLNLPELKVERVELENKTIRIYCHHLNTSGMCPVCQKRSIKVNQYTTHIVRDLNISGREVYLHLRLKQYECTCGRYFIDIPDFIEPNKSHTKRQSKWIFELSIKQPLSEVGALTNTHSKTVERIFYEHSQVNGYERYEGVTQLGIDEFSFRKGKKDYICVLTNLENGETIDILQTRQKEALIAHFQSITLKNGVLFKEQVKIASCDFWGPFLDIIKNEFPNATVIGDRFHWTTYINNVLDATRKALRKEFPKQEAFKSIKWLLFKQPDQNTENETNVLQNALTLSPILEELYYMKNTFIAIFECQFNYDFAIQQVNLWLEQAKNLKNEKLDEFIKFLERQFEPITNFFKHPVSNACTEGNNNLLRTVKRFTFNMTNFEHFKARCFAYKA